eukprot:gb/GECH01010693.1/.p1 GENE.gb/GECH01010693.1/~~gb/GECH01010693.1/.p1  ORF type:complete len:811 (+),score=164.20 gb/GECH01010693.1/:1-2433(+)
MKNRRFSIFVLIVTLISLFICTYASNCYQPFPDLTPGPDYSGFNISRDYESSHDLLNETEKMEDYISKARDGKWSSRPVQPNILEWKFQDMQGERVLSGLEDKSNGTIDPNNVEWLYSKYKTAGVSMKENPDNSEYCDYYIFNGANDEGFQVREENVGDVSAKDIIDRVNSSPYIYFEYWLQQDGCLSDYDWEYTNSVPYLSLYSGTKRDKCESDLMFEFRLKAADSFSCDSSNLLFYDASNPSVDNKESQATCIKESSSTVDNMADLNRGNLTHLVILFTPNDDISVYINGEGDRVGVNVNDIIFPTWNSDNHRIMFGRVPYNTVGTTTRAFGGKLFYFGVGTDLPTLSDASQLYDAGPPNNPPFANSQQVYATYGGEYIEIVLRGEDVEKDTLEIDIIDNNLTRSDLFSELTDNNETKTVSIEIPDNNDSPLVENDTLSFSFQANEFSNHDETDLLTSLPATVTISLLEPPKFDMPNSISKYDFETLNITVHGSHPNEMADKLDNVLINNFECDSILNDLTLKTFTSGSPSFDCGTSFKLGEDNAFEVSSLFIDGEDQGQVNLTFEAYHSLDPSFKQYQDFHIEIVNSLEIEYVSIPDEVDIDTTFSVNINFTDAMSDDYLSHSFQYCVSTISGVSISGDTCFNRTQDSFQMIELMATITDEQLNQLTFSINRQHNGESFGSVHSQNIDIVVNVPSSSESSSPSPSSSSSSDPSPQPSSSSQSSISSSSVSSVASDSSRMSSSESSSSTSTSSSAGASSSSSSDPTGSSRADSSDNSDRSSVSAAPSIGSSVVPCVVLVLSVVLLLSH